MPRHVTLAGQLLALQLLIVLGVLAGVTAVSIAQSGETTRRTESRRALSSAENVAANPLVRQRLPVAVPLADDGLPAAAEGSRALSGARSVLLVRTDGTVVTSADPAQVGRRLAFARPDVVTGAVPGPAWWTPDLARWCRRRCRCSPRRRAASSASR